MNILYSQFGILYTKLRRKKLWISLKGFFQIFLIVLLGLGCSDEGAAQNQKPNILIIEADDMGFSDIGAYGGVISTPNIDQLAKEGIRFTQFHNVPICSPSRASLLTGLYPHQTGIGYLTSAHAKALRDSVGYLDHLNSQCVTIAEALKPAGYKSYMIGKWHVGQKRPYYPVDRGFDESTVRMDGYDYFNPDKVMFVSNEHTIKPSKKGFYMTDYFTQKAVDYLSNHNDKQPFFMYLAYTSPHWPIQAPEEEIAKYQGKFMMGWDSLRVIKYERMKEMGIIKSNWPLSPRDDHSPAWSSLSIEEKKNWDRKMAVYAAVIDIMDQGIGRVMDVLKEKGMGKNTLVLFLSDNGGNGEEVNSGEDPEARPGTPGSFMSYGLPWGNASNDPFRLFKHFVHEGGTATPLIAHWPAGISRESGNLVRERGHIIDIMATTLDVAGASYPEEYKGNKIIPMEGKSLVPYFKGEDIVNHKILYWELQGNKALISGKWKLVALDRHPWELYDLNKDRTELRNLASQYPDTVKELADKWKEWADKVGVVPWSKTGQRPYIFSVHDFTKKPNK